MYFLFLFHKLELFCTILLAFTAVIGDFLVSYFNLQVYKALFDNSTHSIIGGLTWFIVTLKLKNKSVWIRLLEVFLCASIASLIDVDHFIVAKSLKLKDATNIEGRPFLHCSTIPIAVTGLLLVLANIFVSENFFRLAWITFAAFSSHHIRDSTRRGLWFCYFGTTPPLPYYLYIFLTVMIPHLMAILMKLLYVETNDIFYSTLSVSDV